MLVVADAMVVGPDTVAPGWVAIEGDTIAAVGEGAPPAGERLDAGGGYVLPGFIDLDPHGGGGAWTTSGALDDIRAAVDFHLAHGTTRSLVSLTSAPVEELVAGLQAIGQLQGEPGYHDRVQGAHLEGPFLAPARAGAQRREHLRTPDSAFLERLLDAAPGVLRILTLAPELPGADSLITAIAAAGVVASVGHSDGSFDNVMHAFGAGVSMVTHLFNGMPALQSREPGPVGAALSSQSIVCSMVADGIHVHDGTVRAAYHALGPGRLALVTDATAVAGMPPGIYDDGRRRLRVDEGAAYDADSGVLVGSILTMDLVFRRAVHSIGLTILEASRAVSTTPAEVLGIGDQVGTIDAGKRADLVILDADLALRRVILNGHPLDGHAVPVIGA